MQLVRTANSSINKKSVFIIVCKQHLQIFLKGSVEVEYNPSQVPLVLEGELKKTSISLLHWKQWTFDLLWIYFHSSLVLERLVRKEILGKNSHGIGNKRNKEEKETLLFSKVYEEGNESSVLPKHTGFLKTNYNV